MFRFWVLRKVFDIYFRGSNFESESLKFYILKGKRGFCKLKGKVLKELSIKYVIKKKLEREEKWY